jgi:hypothetical protein
MDPKVCTFPAILFYSIKWWRTPNVPWGNTLYTIVGLPLQRSILFVCLWVVLTPTPEVYSTIAKPLTPGDSPHRTNKTKSHFENHPQPSLTQTTSPSQYFSVANSWPNFSVRSTKKFGRWQKNSAPYKIFSQMLIFLSSTNYFSWQRERKIKDIRKLSVHFCRYIKVFIWIIIFKKFGPFSAFFWHFKGKFGRTNFCRTPFELWGRNFGPLATLILQCFGSRIRIRIRLGYSGSRSRRSVVSRNKG